MWLLLTTLESPKQGPALIGRLSGDAKAAAKSLGTDVIGSSLGPQKILEHLDKSYAVDDVDQLGIDLAAFLDYNWKGNISIEEYIASFHSRLDKLSDLKMNDKLKGHLLLRQAGLDLTTSNFIVGAASGNYNNNKISAAARRALHVEKK